MSSYLPPTAAIILPHLGCFLGSSLVSDQDFEWYESLRKPRWCPPHCVFAPVWAVLHSSMGYASFLVWRDCGGFNERSVIPLALYGSTLALNCMWAPTFFVMRNLKLAFFNSLLMWETAGLCVYTFSTVSRQAGGFMVPYFAWITMATALVYRFWRDNRSTVTVEEVTDEPPAKSDEAAADKKSE